MSSQHTNLRPCRASNLRICFRHNPSSAKACSDIAVAVLQKPLVDHGVSSQCLRSGPPVARNVPGFAPQDFSLMRPPAMNIHINSSARAGPEARIAKRIWTEPGGKSKVEWAGCARTRDTPSLQMQNTMKVEDNLKAVRRRDNLSLVRRTVKTRAVAVAGRRRRRKPET
jgi:hypothetical protein